MRGVCGLSGMTAVLLCAAAIPAAGQSIAQRVAQAPNGKVRMTFAAKPGVCGNGHNISVNQENDEWVGDCDHGPVRVVLTRAGGAVVDVNTYVGGHWRAGAPGVDLGMVSAPAAADYLLSLTVKGAIFAATLADSATVWPKLAEIARDPAVPRDVRRNAVFWLGQAAGDKAVKDLAGLATGPHTNRDVQEQAVFALSQLHDHAGVPELIDIAQTHPDPAVRKRAMFWLGQSGDPRAIALFEKILTKP